MVFALDRDGKRVHANDADKREEYTCPVCGAKVIPRQGELNIWHYAHVTPCEDQWEYDMSEWHKAWQEKFPVGNREVVVEFSGEKHRADVLVGKYVLEFQHSPISAEEIMRRNSFYIRAGYKVIWIFDVIDAYDQGKIEGDMTTFTWKYANRALSCIVPQNNEDVAVIFQLTEGNEVEGFTSWLAIVEWAIPADSGWADYKKFIVDDFFDPDLFSEEGLSEIMLNKRGRFYKFLRDNAPYKQKCGRVKGQHRQWYVCEKTGEWHNGACEACPHNLVREYRCGNQYHRGGIFFYCCYPRVMHDIGHSELPDHERTPTIRI